MRSIQSTLFTLLVASSATYAETTFNLTPGVSPISHDVYQLHMTIFWICVAIGILVFGVMIYSMIYHRKSRGAKPGHFHTHPVLEVAWTIVPVIILVLMAIPATKVLLNMNNEDKEFMTVKITGYQWKWHYEYMEDGIKFFSNLSTPFSQIHNQEPKSPDYLREVDHPLVVPIHKKIRFLITSNDVNHAWWVPDFAVKRDAISGFINEAWTIIDKPGTYRGQCAELCGINHAFMPIVVIAMSEQGYKDWVAKQKGQASQGDAEINKNWTMEELMKNGEQVYSRICAACHQPTGLGLPPTFPALKGSKVATGPIEKHIETVMNGVSGTAMQAFKGQMTDVELASVITYERNAFGNNTGTMVQPIQIKAYHDGKSIGEALTVKPSGNVAPATPAASAPATEKAAPPAPAVAPTAKAAPSEEAPASATDGPSVTPDDTITNKSIEVKSSTPPAVEGSLAAPEPEAPAQPAQAPKAATPPTPEEVKAAIARGEKVYLGTCAACHQPSGEGMPPTFPALKGDAIVKGPVINHIEKVLNGKQGTAMMAFKDQLSDQDIADVISYERNTFGDDSGKIETADDIKAARQQDENNKQEGAKQ